MSVKRAFDNVGDLISKANSALDNKDGIKTNVTVNLGMQTYVNLLMTIVTAACLIIAVVFLYRKVLSK